MSAPIAWGIAKNGRLLASYTCEDSESAREMAERFAASGVTVTVVPLYPSAALRRLLDSAAISDAGKSGKTGNATPEPAIPPAWLARPYWVDPPEGWRWGFPRLYDPAKDGDMTEWLIRQGYPERLARQELACTFTAATEGDTVAKDDNACRNNLTETGEK